MALVAYSDSEDSDPDAPAVAAKPATSSRPAANAAPFQKTEARKIRVDLPALKPEPGQQDRDDAEQPPAKRVRTAGAFGGFNSLLPAPKRAAAQPTGLKKGVSLKTSSEAAFSRAVPPVLRSEGRAPQAQEETYDEFGNRPQPKTKLVEDGSRGEVEVKPVGKATRFKPLSVANNKKKKVVKKPFPAFTEAIMAKNEPEPGSITVDDRATPPPSAPVAKPKKSLFSVQHEDEPSPEPTAESYEALIASKPEHENSFTQPAFAQPTARAPARDSLEAVAADMNLTPAQRRQLFGRHAKGVPASIAHFNMDAEYAANEQIRQSGETIEHRAVKTVAPGKHSLQQLVNNARTNQDSIEDKYAEGRRSRGDAGNRYGWGK